MQLMFVLLISALMAFTISSIGQNTDQATTNYSIYKSMNDKLKVTDRLSVAVRKSYDRGLSNVGCSAGAVEVSDLNTTFKLCWTNVENDCFTDILFQGRAVCFSNNQDSLTKNLIEKTPFHQFLNFLIPTAHADSSISYLRDLEYTTYNGINLTSQAAEFTNGDVTPNKAGARIIAPTQNGVDSNFINCSTDYTECFSISFCLNGSTSCAQKNKLTQSFAVRHFR